MLNLGMVGWRSMVGSVLMDRMNQEHDFKLAKATFFSTSQAGQKAPEVEGQDTGTLQDAYSLEALRAMDVIITTQGGDYSKKIYPQTI